MNKRLLISLGFLVIALIVIIIIFNSSRSNPNQGQYFSVSTWTATSSSSQGPITYSVKHVSEGYVYSMSGSFGTVWATTTSLTNPFTACREQYDATKPDTKDNIVSTYQDWTAFDMANYGFAMKYPKDWILKEKTLENGFHGVSLTKDSAEISISEKGGSVNINSGRSVCDQNDYYQLKIGNEYIARPKSPEIYEEGVQKFFPVCQLSNYSCNDAIKIRDNDYLFIEYLLIQGGSFNPDLINQMDAIVGTIQFRQ